MSRTAKSSKWDPGIVTWRGVGLLLLLLGALPLYQLLAGPSSGLSHQEAIRMGSRYHPDMWRGTLLLLGLGLGLGLLAGDRVHSLAVRLGEWLTSIPKGRLAASLALLAGGLTFVMVRWVLEGKPALAVTAVQLIQARYFAEGALAAPILEFPEFWMVQYTLQTSQGWLSQYPPIHTLFLALGFALGSIQIVGPVLMAIMAALGVYVLDRLLPDTPGTARLGAVLIAVSPFSIGLAGSHLTHTSTAALALAAAWFALRALDGSWTWSIGAGLCAGAMLGSRPLAAVVIGGTVTLLLWATVPQRTGSDQPGARLSLRQTSARLGGAFLGSLVPGIALMLYNAHFFGNPLRFGYAVAGGGSQSFGFHIDPFGFYYGPKQAVGMTSTDLIALGRDLHGMLLSAVILIGVYMLATRQRPAAGKIVIAAWALLPVVVNFFYYHHDYALGPRMLGETAPAWCALVAIAMVGLVRSAPANPTFGRLSPRSWAACTLSLALVSGLLWFGPRRLEVMGDRVAGEPPVRLNSTIPSLVFVHEAWEDRLGARIAARGAPLERVRAIVSSAPPCVVQLAIDREIGNPDPAECERQDRSDRFGTLGLTTVLWRGDLPGLEPAGAMWVRDLGPEHNRRLIEANPDRVPLVLAPPVGGRSWSLVSYEEGMSVLWRER